MKIKVAPQTGSNINTAAELTSSQGLEHIPLLGVLLAEPRSLAESKVGFSASKSCCEDAKSKALPFLSLGDYF